MSDLTAEAETLGEWTAYCRKHEMFEKGKALLLLQDFAEGIMSDEFYRRHAEEALVTLEGLDQTKKGVVAVQEKLRPIIESREG